MWSFCPFAISWPTVLRLVLQEKEVLVKLTSLGGVRIYTKETYHQQYGRDPADDGIQAESFTAPSGQQLQVFKAGAEFPQQTLGVQNENGADCPASKMRTPSMIDCFVFGRSSMD